MLKVGDNIALVTAYLSSDRLLFSSIQGKQHKLGIKEAHKCKLIEAIMDYQPYIQRKLRTDDVSAMLNSFGLLEESFNEKNYSLSSLKSFYAGMAIVLLLNLKN